MARQSKNAGDRIAREALERELAVLCGGRWSAAWYWRDDLERMQANRVHCCPELAAYRPTSRWESNPASPETRGRVWMQLPEGSAE